MSKNHAEAFGVDSAVWFVALDRLLKVGELPRAFTRKAASATPIPLHQGARDYNRGRQVILHDQVPQ